MPGFAAQMLVFKRFLRRRVTRECEFEAGKYRQPLLDPGWPGLRPGSLARRLRAGCAAQKSLFQDAANRARLRESNNEPEFLSLDRGVH